MPLRNAAALPYTDVVLRSLVTVAGDPTRVEGSGILSGLDPDDVATVRRAGKSVLVAVECGRAMEEAQGNPACATGLAASVAAFVAARGLDGVELSLARSTPASSASSLADGGFLLELTCALHEALPENGRVVTHCIPASYLEAGPAPPYLALLRDLKDRAGPVLEWLTIQHAEDDSPARVASLHRRVARWSLSGRDRTILVGLPHPGDGRRAGSPDLVADEIVRPLLRRHDHLRGVASAHYAVDRDEAFAWRIWSALSDG